MFPRIRTESIQDVSSVPYEALSTGWPVFFGKVDCVTIPFPFHPSLSASVNRLFPWIKWFPCILMFESACVRIPLIIVIWWIIWQQWCPISAFPRLARIVIVPFAASICGHNPNEPGKKDHDGYHHQNANALAYPTKYGPKNFLHCYKSLCLLWLCDCLVNNIALLIIGQRQSIKISSAARGLNYMQICINLRRLCIILFRSLRSNRIGLCRGRLRRGRRSRW